MYAIYAAILAALILIPLYPIYRRKVKGKPVKTPLLANIFSFFLVGVGMVALGLSGAASAAETTEAVAHALDPQAGLGFIAAALATGLSGIGGGIAVAASASAALGAISEDEKTFGKALIFVALAEGIALYGMIISFSILGKIQ